MTNKQIIIDGCDVSGCEFYLPYSEKCECMVDDNGNNNLFCREYRDCYYKRMYHTGQEKDIYKNENKELYKQLKRKEQECEGLRYEIGSLENDRDILQEQLDQLKAENENWQKEYWKLEQGNDFWAEKNSRLRGCLTEIKEIAERCGKRIPLFEIDEIAEDLKQILQKISECEVK